jgi:hypothetical protein
MEENLQLTANWYFEVHWNNANILDLCQAQVSWYENKL